MKNFIEFGCFHNFNARSARFAAVHYFNNLIHAIRHEREPRHV